MLKKYKWAGTQGQVFKPSPVPGQSDCRIVRLADGGVLVINLNHPNNPLATFGRVKPVLTP